MDSVFDTAITNYFTNNFEGSLFINNKYGLADEMPLDVYFRENQDLNGLESYALSLCAGKTLDVGAGAGALSLILQDRGIDVDAIEISKACAHIMQIRGVKNVINKDFFSEEHDAKYDTLLVMMNGIGICQTMKVLTQFFIRCKALLKEGGQVLLDSSDVRYLYDDFPLGNQYFGEIDFQYQYQNEKGPWFKWLYVDIDTLVQEADRNGFYVQVLSEDSSGHYLARLIRHY